ncbi:MAG: NitT/TauT family transport system permease protein [Thermoplasmata archaeon]|nr:NitT/TauT family transport system permease protein [Thermoplasmata archaeon]
MARRIVPERFERAAAWLGVLVLAVTLGSLIGAGARPDAPEALSLPYLAARSILRMLLAFVLSLTFAITYGYTAATSKRAAKVLLPLLDILQSVPILAFFPAAVLFFVSLFNGSVLGLEAASVFLIFTSQSWNMAFGVYEAITTIPRDTWDAGEVLGAAGWMRLRRVILPACVPKLVYNGIVSWAGGWYFVTASEIISTANGEIQLPGLGAFLSHAARAGDWAQVLLGTAVLVLAVLAFELAIWRPLQVWAERFKFESVRSTTQPRSRALDFYRLLRGAGGGLPRIPLLGSVNVKPVRLPARLRNPRVLKASRVALALAFAALLLGVAALLATALVKVLLAGVPAETTSIPLALLASTLRLSVAYAITLAWTVPAAIFIARNERASRILIPVTEVMASIPAVAFFPLILLLFIGLTGGLGFASVLLVLTGMQWYLLFNLIAGARQVPADLLSAAEIQGVKGILLWRRVMIPAMTPALITGSITAWGGGWNALIVSEFVQWRGTSYHTFGIGYLIDKAVYETRDPGLLLLSVLSMVVFIYAINALLWRRLYRRAVTKYSLEGAQ